jgi:hypothetical protein
VDELKLEQLDVLDCCGAGGNLERQYTTACFVFSCLNKLHDLFCGLVAIR